MRAVLVGELNPRGSDPRWALWPEPRGCAGGRLCGIFGLTPIEYVQRFERLNLCSGAWDPVAARRRADEVEDVFRGRVLVLLGRRVCRAFGVAYGPFSFDASRLLAVLPHPSGRCRAWNDASAAGRARETLRLAGAL